MLIPFCYFNDLSRKLTSPHLIIVGRSNAFREWFVGVQPFGCLPRSLKDELTS